MAPKEIDLKQFSDDFEVRWEIYAAMRNGCCLESALIIAGVKKTNFVAGPPTGPSQPLLWEENPVHIFKE